MGAMKNFLIGVANELGVEPNSDVACLEASRRLNDEMTPLEAMQIAEQRPGLSAKERQKILALALTRIAKSPVELMMLWGFSQGVARLMGFEIPDLDEGFVLEINQDPAKFLEYK